MGVLDAPAPALREFRTMQRDHPVPMCTKAFPALDSSLAPTVGLLGGSARTVHTATRTAHGIQAEFANWYTGPGPAETDPSNDVFVTAALVYQSVVLPLRFSGARQTRISPGGRVRSDPCGVEIPKGATFYVITWVGVESGGVFPRNIPLSNAVEGHNYSATGGPDLTGGIGSALAGVNINTAAFGPVAVLGRVADPGKPVVLLAGDSILYGSSDTSTGYGVRALAGDYAYLKVAMPGEGLAQFLSSAGSYRHRRLSIAEGASCTHVLTDYTVNSLSSSTIQADAVTAWGILAKYGRLIACTLTPQTTSTDAWATVGNQTQMYPSDREPRRLAFNAWLRDGAPLSGLVPQAPGSTGVARAGQSGHPLTAVAEVADQAETTRDSGIWRAGYTSDGTHPNATGATALAAGVDPVKLFGARST